MSFSFTPFFIPDYGTCQNICPCLLRRSRNSNNRTTRLPLELLVCWWVGLFKAPITPAVYIFWLMTVPLRQKVTKFCDSFNGRYFTSCQFDSLQRVKIYKRNRTYEQWSSVEGIKSLK